MIRIRLWLLIGTVAVLLGLGGGFWWWSHRDRVRYVTAKVTAGAIERSVAMTGTLNPVVTAQVGSYVSGNIKSWSCDYNTLVKIGQVCAKIDPLPFQVVVDENAADLKTSQAQLVKDRAALVNARLTYERDLKLLEQNIVSQAQVESDKSTFEQAKAQIDLDGATIASHEASLKAAQVNLDYTDIVSPVNGMVITRYIDIGQTVVSNLQSSTLFLIGKDLAKMQVDTNVSEADIGEVKPGNRAHFTVQAYPKRTFQAVVRQVREGPITVQNVVTYDVVLDVDNADQALFPGMTADAHIVTDERKDVLRVPLPATRFVPEGAAQRGGGGGGGRGGGSDQARLWLLTNGELHSIRVRTGLDDGTLIEVSGEGLKAGDEVVVNAVHTGGGSRPADLRPPGSNPGRPGGGPRL